MDTEQHDEDLSHWFSTYGLITAERILGKYYIELRHDELIAAVKNAGSFYNRLLQVPIKHVLNGIVIQQAYDYHAYVQKLFIDYLLSGTSGDGGGEEEGSAPQGSASKEAMEAERTDLLAVGEAFTKLQSDQDNLIATSQSEIIAGVREWNATKDVALSAIASILKDSGIEVKPSVISNALEHAIAHCYMGDNQTKENQMQFVDSMNEIFKANLSPDVKQKLVDSLSNVFTIAITFEARLLEFYDQTLNIKQQARDFRKLFYDTILRVMDLIKLLPEYKVDPLQDKINREQLEFDKSVGGE